MKKFSIVLAAVALAASLTACGSKSSDEGSKSSAAPSAAATVAASAAPKAEGTDKLAEIKKAGKIVLGTSADYAPFEFHKVIDGKDTIVGFDIEIAKEIAKDMGVQLEIKDMGFDGLLEALQSGKVDMVISGMTPKPERQKVVDFSKVYYNAEQIIVVRTEDMEKFKSMDDIKKANIGVQSASLQEDMAKEQAAGANIKSIQKIPDLVMQLKGKKIDAIFMESPVAAGYIKKNADVSISTVKPKAELTGSAIAVKKNNPEYLAQINKTLDRVMGDKTLDKYISEASALSIE